MVVVSLETNLYPFIFAEPDNHCNAARAAHTIHTHRHDNIRLRFLSRMLQFYGVVVRAFPPSSNLL